MLETFFMQFKSSSYQFYDALEKALGISCDSVIEFVPYEKYNKCIVTQKFKIYEDWWGAKPAVVISKVQSIIGVSERIFARKTKVLKIDKPTCDAFLDENHIYGTTKAKHKIGLFYLSELVAVATFSAQRNLDVGRSAELIRFCSKNGTTIVGGLDKLIKFYIKTYMPNHIMTYIDKDWGSGKSFLNLGFNFTAEREAIYYCINLTTGKRIVKGENTIDCELGIKNGGSLKFEMELKNL